MIRKSILSATGACLTGTCLAVASLGANAAVYNISSVLTGTGSNNGGFSFSSFHDSSDGDPRGGDTLAEISNPVISGTYNDATGAFDAVLTVSGAAGPTVSLSGNLLFGMDGFLNQAGTVDADFDGSNGALSDTTLGFLAGDLCCNGAADPNSLRDINGTLTMTLWGANWLYTDSNGATLPDAPFNGNLAFNKGAYEGTTLGMDLRVELSEVPVPAAAWLFGTGLIGLIGVARRKA